MCKSLLIWVHSFLCTPRKTRLHKNLGKTHQIKTKSNEQADGTKRKNFAGGQIKIYWTLDMGRRKSLLVYDSFEAHMTDTVNTSFKRELPFSSRSMYLWTNHLEMESERSGWLMEFTNLLDDKKRLRRNWSVRIFHKRRKAFHQKWSLPLSEVWDHKQFEWITRWIGLQFNWDHWWTWGFSHRNLFESDCESEFEGFVV